MDEQTFDQIKEFIEDQYMIDITRYKRQQMIRRLDAWLRRSSLNNWDDYFQMVREDQNEDVRFRNYLTINVTSFFRDPDRWAVFEKDVLPGVLSNGNGSPSLLSRSLKVWSAGCSIGAEPYTLGIILNRVTPYADHDFLATDFDRGALEIARAGGPFIRDDVKNIPEDDLMKYFRREDDHYYVKGLLRDKIQFREGDLLSDQFDDGYDLIICRNVVIYFTPEIKDELFVKFHSSLVEDGVLFLGGTEMIPHASGSGFRHIGGSIYKKIAI